MTRDRSGWVQDDERLPVDQYGRRSPAGSAPGPYGGQDDYAPRAPRARHASHDAYGPPDAYPPPDAYGPPDPYAPPDPGGPPAAYGRSGGYGPPDAYGTPEPYGPPAPSGRPGGYGPADSGSQTDPLGPQDPYAQPDPFGQPEPFGQADRFGRSDPISRPDHYGQADPAGQPAHHSRPDPFANHDAFGPPDPHAGRDDSYDRPDAVGHTDPFGGQNGFGRPAGRAGPVNSYRQADPFGLPDAQGAPPAPHRGPDPGGDWNDYRQQDWRSGQDPLRGRAGDRQDVRYPQDRHRARDDDGLTDPGGRPGGPDVSGWPAPGGYQDPHASPPVLPGQGGVLPEPEAPSSGPYRWRPAAEPGRPESAASDVQGGRERRTGDWQYPDQDPGAGDRSEWGQLPGEPDVWPDPVSQDSGWHEPAREHAGWQDPAGSGAGWHQPGEQAGWNEPVTGEAGWQQPVGHNPVHQEPVRPDPGWQQPAASDDQGWQDQEDPDSGFLPGFSDGAGGGRAAGRRLRRRRIRWVAPLVAFIIILAALGGAGNYIFRRYEASHANYQGPGTGSVIVHVLPGDSPILLAPRLVRLGVIKSVDPFKAAAKDSRSLAGLEPGYFRLRKHMNAALAYALLVNPKSRIQVAVTIPEGLRISQVVTSLSAKTGIPASQFTRALKNPAALGLPAYASGKPEGYLFPATYNIEPRATAVGILQQMVQSFNREATTINLADAAKHGKISENHAIIVASLVQAEGGRLQDFAKIARVIYNRLSTGMPLELDSTVMFAINKYGIRATLAQTHVNSPYNTYLHTGLPPGPIDSPGDAAIKAALHPAAGNWRYFVTVDPKTGLTKFTSSHAEFERFVQELNKNLLAGK